MRRNLTSGDLAKHLNCHPSSIRYWTRKYDFPHAVPGTKQRYYNLEEVINFMIERRECIHLPNKIWRAAEQINDKIQKTSKDTGNKETKPMNKTLNNIGNSVAKMWADVTQGIPDDPREWTEEHAQIYNSRLQSYPRSAPTSPKPQAFGWRQERAVEEILVQVYRIVRQNDFRSLQAVCDALGIPYQA